MGYSLVTKGYPMTKEAMRTHVVMSRDLVAAVDELVGHRRRSEFVAAAVEERVRRERLGRALDATAGILKPEDHPEWATPEGVHAWVRAGRALDEERLARKLGEDQGE